MRKLLQKKRYDTILKVIISAFKEGEVDHPHLDIEMSMFLNIKGCPSPHSHTHTGTYTHIPLISTYNNSN